MLYAKSRSCVHTYTKATYDVHAVFSVHVCHSHMDRIICSLLVIVYFPLYFQVFLLGVYKQYTQLMSIAIAWNFTGIWHMAHGCLDIQHFTKYTSGISYILMEIPTYQYHPDGTQRYIRLVTFITVWLYPDVYPFFIACILVHRVHIVLTFSHGFYVYETYTSGILRVHVAPQKCT